MSKFIPDQTYSVWRGGQEGDYVNLPAWELTKEECERFKIEVVMPLPRAPLPGSVQSCLHKPWTRTLKAV